MWAGMARWVEAGTRLRGQVWAWVRLTWMQVGCKHEHKNKGKRKKKLLTLLICK